VKCLLLRLLIIQNLLEKDWSLIKHHLRTNILNHWSMLWIRT